MRQRTRQLTPAQTAIVSLLAEGMTRPGIALTLGITENTVRTHVQNMMTKLHLHTQAHLVAYAYEEGIIEPRWRLVLASDLRRLMEETPDDERA